MENWNDYTIEYPYKGSIWVFTVKATSQEDAEARLAAIRNFGKCRGMIESRLPGWLPVWAVVLFCRYLDWRDSR